MSGTTIGAVFYIPAAIMWATGKFTPALKPRILVLGGLLACQGLLGWYMVKSGLDHKNFEGPNDVPRVSQYRLASHLGAAMVRKFELLAQITVILIAFFLGFVLIFAVEFPGNSAAQQSHQPQQLLDRNEVQIAQVS